MRQEEFNLGVAAQPAQHTYAGYTITHDPNGHVGHISHVSDPSSIIDTVPVHKGMVKQALVYWHKNAKGLW